MSYKLQKVTSEHGLKLKNNDTKETWLEIYARLDGCVEITKYFNTPKELREEGKESDTLDELHICDIDEMIEILQEVKSRALEHFGADWNS